MQKHLYRHGERMVAIVTVDTFEQWKLAVQQGYAVATTTEQRREWGLGPSDDLPCLPTQEVVEVAFLAPEDPVIEELEATNPDVNLDLPPEVENGEAIEAPDGSLYRLTPEGNLALDDQGDPIPLERFPGARTRPFSPEESV